MKKIYILMAIIFISNFSYSQIYEIKKSTQEELDNLVFKQNAYCFEDIPYDYPFISIITCFPYTTLLSPYIADTIVINIKINAHFYFTDSLDYLVITNIRHNIPDHLQFYKNNELFENELKNKVKELLDSSNFFYVPRGTIRDFGIYFNIPLKCMPE